MQLCLSVSWPRGVGMSFSRPKGLMMLEHVHKLNSFLLGSNNFSIRVVKNGCREFPVGPVVRALWFHYRGVQSLAGELRSHKLRGWTIKKKVSYATLREDEELWISWGRTLNLSNLVPPYCGPQGSLSWTSSLHPSIRLIWVGGEQGQFSSVAQSCPTLCNPMDCSTPGFPVHHQLPELTQTRPLSQWCQPTISSSVIPFSSCLQSFPVSESFLVSQFFTSGGQSIGVSASTSVLPMNIQD